MKKLINILKIIVAIPLSIIALVVAFYLLIGILQPFFYALKWLYETTPIYALIDVAWIVVVVVLTVCIRCFNRAKRQYSPVLRTVYYKLFEYLLLYTLLGIIVLLICNWSDIVEPVYNQTFLAKITFLTEAYLDKYDILNNQIKVGLMHIAFLSLALLNYKRDIVYYVTIPKFRYNLYLRSFFMDESIQIGEEIKANFAGELVEIADPTTEFGNRGFVGKDLFLTTNNWKREVSYYIKRANLVFCCIGTGKGVLWEMFEHDREVEKYVYYVNDGGVLWNIVESCSSKYLNNRVGQAIKRLLEVDSESPFYFIVRDKRCYYSKELSYMAELIKTGNGPAELKTFEIEVEPVKRGDVGRKLDIYDWFKDVQRIISTMLRPANFAVFGKAIVGLFGVIVWLLGFLGGVFLLLMGVVSLLSIVFPVLDFMEMETVWRKLCAAVFYPTLGALWLWYVGDSVKK